MPPELDWTDQTQSTATPSDAPEPALKQAKPTPPEQHSDARNHAAHKGDATATHSDVVAGRLKQDHDQQPTDDWPSPGDALLTVNDTRLHLLDRHDIYLKDRYTQKLRTDYHKLEGRRLPKAGGGLELKITQSSIDRFAKTFNENRTTPQAAETPLDPQDKLFDKLREIAGRKPYGIIVESDAVATPKDRIETPTAAPPDDEIKDIEKNVQEKRDATATPTEETAPPIETPPTAVSREMFQLAQTHANYFQTELKAEKEKREKALYDRETDREEFNKKLEQQQQDFTKQYGELLDEHSQAWGEILKLKDANTTLKAAYTEATAKLPAGADLTIDITGADNPGQTELITIRPPVTPYKSNPAHYGQY